MDYFKIIELNGKRLAVYKTGEIIFWDNSPYDRYYKKNTWNIHKKQYDKDGYVRYNVGNKKYYTHHRIVGYTFLNLDLNDSKQKIDHINGIRDDNRLENLRVVNDLKNQWNRHTVKGYYWNKGKFRASIRDENGNKIYLGGYDTEEEARQAYLDAKEIYHIF